MGHYCKICGRVRANEKFSGIGHKNHICKDCTRKPVKKRHAELFDNTVFEAVSIKKTQTKISEKECEYFDEFYGLVDEANINETQEENNNTDIPF